MERSERRDLFPGERSLRILPSQNCDAETGKHYNYFRDYDPALGRYIESDPIGLKGGLNTYAYVGGNSLTRTDKFGQDYWIEGSVDGEGGHPFHQSVCVGKPAGPRTCISFGVSEDRCLMNCNGEVYPDTSAAGPIVNNSYQNTSAEDDRKIGAMFNSMIGSQGNYWLLGNNCRNFSRRVWDYLFLNYSAAGRR